MMTALWSSLSSALPLAGWVPFVTPLPMWSYWWVLLLPLIVAVAVVYKAVKCESTRRVPIESVQLTLYILTFMAAGALLLGVYVEWRG